MRQYMCLYVDIRTKQKILFKAYFLRLSISCYSINTKNKKKKRKYKFSLTVACVIVVKKKQN
jgi:hypothetical protein